MSVEKGEWINLSDCLPGTPKIAVADDDWLNRDLLETYLTQAGCQVSVFPDGETAWAGIQEDPPDIALLDVRMPNMDGITLCGLIKQNPQLGFIPVILVTAFDEEEEKLRAIQAGADDFIGKPYSSVVLVTRVRSLLNNKRLHDELEGRNRLLRQVLNRYVDSELAGVILTDPERHLKLGGETRFVTVLFADLRGFTKFTESHPADQVVETLNAIFTELTEVVFKHGGTFDKYLGDAVMAFYGAPFEGEDDVERALRTALEMQSRFKQLMEENPLAASLGGLGIGVHAGEVIVGNIGSERMMDYTVIGDNVVISRRLQEIARPGEILISEDTLKRAQNAQVSQQITQRLPGRSGEVTIYSLESLPDK
jgi:class 3 adenylate cyclase/ActR/RegA family two-component response regulator